MRIHSPRKKQQKLPELGGQFVKILTCEIGLMNRGYQYIFGARKAQHARVRTCYFRKTQTRN